MAKGVIICTASDDQKVKSWRINVHVHVKGGEEEAVTGVAMRNAEPPGGRDWLSASPHLTIRARVWILGYLPIATFSIAILSTAL